LNPNIKLIEFLKISRHVTENYIKALNGRKWTKTDQWNKIREEEVEFRNATDRLNELEEFWDNFFAKLTLLHLEDFDDNTIMTSAISTWNKIHERSEKALMLN
jgi:hypothetical protein